MRVTRLVWSIAALSCLVALAGCESRSGAGAGASASASASGSSTASTGVGTDLGTGTQNAISSGLVKKGVEVPKPPSPPGGPVPIPYPNVVQAKKTSDGLQTSKVSAD